MSVYLRKLEGIGYQNIRSGVFDRMADTFKTKRDEEKAKIELDLPKFSEMKHLFDKQHYEILKNRPADMKEAEALFRRYEQKLAEFDSIQLDLEKVESELDRLDERVEKNKF